MSEGTPGIPEESRDESARDETSSGNLKKPSVFGRVRSFAMSSTFESLKIRDFRVLWFGFMGSWSGNQILQVARGYLAFELTGSAFAIGLVTLANGLPRIALAPIGGYLADRFNKRDVIIWTSMPLALLSVVMGAFYVSHLLTMTWLVTLSFLQGICFSLLMPARQAYPPQVVGTGHLLANAVALNNAGMNMTRMVGPAIAGLMIAAPHFGLTGTFFSIAACWLWVTWSTWRVENEGVPTGPAKRMGESVREGFKYVRRVPGLLVLMSLGFIPLALGLPYLNLMPAVAAGPLHGGSTLLGVLLSIGGMGSLAGTLLVASSARYEKKAALQLVLGVSFGLALVGFGYFVRMDDLLLAIPFLFFTGMAGDAYQALNSSLIIMSAEPAQYGRVMGVFMIVQSIRPISVLPVSAVADQIGTPLTLLGSGAIVAVFVAGVAALYPAYKKIGRGEPAGVIVDPEV